MAFGVATVVSTRRAAVDVAEFEQGFRRALQESYPTHAIMTAREFNTALAAGDTRCVHQTHYCVQTDQTFVVVRNGDGAPARRPRRAFNFEGEPA